MVAIPLGLAAAFGIAVLVATVAPLFWRPLEVSTGPAPATRARVWPLSVRRLPFRARVVGPCCPEWCDFCPFNRDFCDGRERDSCD